MIRVVYVIASLLIASAFAANIRIAGGERSSLGQFPYTVEIVSQYSDGSAGFCGGSLLNSRFVLTAAHCFLEEARQPQSIIAILGTNNLQSADRTVIAVSHAITHPNYNNETAENDVALVLLSQEVAETSTIQYALIGTQNPSINTDLLVAGWGLNNNRQTAPPAQQSYATLTLVSGQRCANFFRTFNTQTTLCLFGNNQQPCVGDSGSGLVTRASGQARYTIYGLVSFGTDSCTDSTDSLNGFTSVQNYYDFITFNGNPNATLPTGNADGSPIIVSGTIPSAAQPTNAGQIIGVPVDQTPPPQERSSAIITQVSLLLLVVCLILNL